MSQTPAAKKIRAKRARRPIYGEFVAVAVLETGEHRVAFVTQHQIDGRLMKERGWRRGDQARAEFKKSRNVKFHRLAHALGHLLVDNVDGFESQNAHDAIKRVQLEADVCCDTVEMDATPVISALLDAAEAVLGAGARKVLAAVLPQIRTIPVRVARSLAFDEMEEDEFAEFFKGICDYIDQHYQSAMTDDVRTEYFLMVES